MSQGCHQELIPRIFGPLVGLFVGAGGGVLKFRDMGGGGGGGGGREEEGRKERRGGGNGRREGRRGESGAPDGPKLEPNRSRPSRLPSGVRSRRWGGEE